MSDPNQIQLAQLMGHLAADAVNAQRLFDDAYQGALVKAATGIPVPQWDLLRHLLPPRMRIGHWDVDCSVGLTAAVETRFSIEAKILNLGYQIRFRNSTSRESRIRVRVEQVPAPNTHDVRSLARGKE